MHLPKIEVNSDISGWGIELSDRTHIRSWTASFDLWLYFLMVIRSEKYIYESRTYEQWTDGRWNIDTDIGSICDLSFNGSYAVAVASKCPYKSQAV